MHAAPFLFFSRLLFTRRREQLVTGIRAVVIPLALLSEEEMKQSNVLIEDKSTLISFAVLPYVVFSFFVLFF